MTIVAGFREAITSAPGIECVTIQPANSERAMGMSVMENILTTHPDLKAVFATNDQMALGAVEAVAARNSTGRVSVVGVDATKEAVAAVQKGDLAADVAMHPEALGRGAVEAAIKAARREPVNKIINTGETLVTKENAAEFCDSRCFESRTSGKALAVCRFFAMCLSMSARERCTLSQARTGPGSRR